MQSLFFLSALLLAPLTVLGAEKWENCLDEVNFTFTKEDFFRGFTRVSKAQCIVSFAISGGKGEKYELDLCEPVIQIKKYAGFESNTPDRLVAGSAGCPRPLFGADFDENIKDIQEFRAARLRILDLWESVRKFHLDATTKPDQPVILTDDNKMTLVHLDCGDYLLKEYLERCTSFEAKKPPVTPHVPRKSDIPGVHDEEIRIKKTK